MKSFFTLAGKSAPLLFALVLISGAAHAQETFFYTAYPYEGQYPDAPQDFNKTVYGKTMPELCAQRTTEEIAHIGTPHPSLPVIFAGWLPSGANGHCAFFSGSLVIRRQSKRFRSFQRTQGPARRY